MFFFSVVHLFTQSGKRETRGSASKIIPLACELRSIPVLKHRFCAVFLCCVFDDQNCS